MHNRPIIFVQGTIFNVVQEAPYRNAVLLWVFIYFIIDQSNQFNYFQINSLDEDQRFISWIFKLFCQTALQRDLCMWNRSSHVYERMVRDLSYYFPRINRCAIKHVFWRILRNLLLNAAGPFTCAEDIVHVTNALAVEYLSIIFAMFISAIRISFIVTSICSWQTSVAHLHGRC